MLRPDGGQRRSFFSTTVEMSTVYRVHRYRNGVTERGGLLPTIVRPNGFFILHPAIRPCPLWVEELSEEVMKTVPLTIRGST